MAVSFTFHFRQAVNKHPSLFLAMTHNTTKSFNRNYTYDSFVILLDQM